MLLLPDRHLGDPHSALGGEGLLKNSVGLDPGLLRGKEIGGLVHPRVDLGLVDELNDVDQLVAFGIGRGEFIVGEHDVAVLLELVALDDVIPDDLRAVGFGHSLVLDRRVVGLAELFELGGLVVGGGVQTDGDGHQPEVDGAFPDCSSHVDKSMPLWEQVF